MQNPHTDPIYVSTDFGILTDGLATESIIFPEPFPMLYYDSGGIENEAQISYVAKYPSVILHLSFVFCQNHDIMAVV